MSLALSKTDKDFLYRKVTLMDFKAITMERALVAFLARLKHSGFNSRVVRNVDLTVEDLAEELLKMEDKFVNFRSHQDVVIRWFEAHLVDITNRGKPTAAMTSPRPLHGYVYRFRNPKHSKVYGTDQQLYELLYSAGGDGQKALAALKRFFFEGEDPLTGQEQADALVDVETQALRSLKNQVTRDVAESGSREESFKPLCETAPRVFAEDVLRLLAYRDFVPRSVMVEYLVTLLGFHLGLYLLRMIQIVPRLVESQGAVGSCSCVHGACRSQAALVLDIAGLPSTPMARLAERSAATQFQRIPSFVRANFAARKLDDYAAHLKKTRGLNFDHLADVMKLNGSKFESDREGYFQSRLSRLLEDSDANGFSPEVEELLKLAPTNMERYIEVIVHERGEYHRRYVTQAVDAVFFKNTAAGLIAQTRTRGSPRRWVLGGRLLEVLLQVVMLQPGGRYGFHTAPLRFTDLLDRLRDRYGLYIDRLPASEGFEDPSVAERAALRGNTDALKSRLRELGFFRDLSDASITQFVTARYMVRR